MSTMHAIRISSFGDPSVLKLESVPIPQPSASQVLVKIMSTGVNPVETYIRSGAHSIKPVLPYTPGADAAGIIEAVGQNVKNVSVGKRVFVTGSISGTYAQYAVAEATNVFSLPESLSFDQGAAINIPYKTAFLAYSRAHARASQTVFVHGGSGAVGIAAIQMARSIGMKVVASAGTADGLALVERIGAHKAVNHRAEGYLSEVLSFTEGRGVDLILEMAAHTNFAKDFEVLANHGSIAIIGARAPLEFHPRLIMSKNAHVLGIMANWFASEQEEKECWASINAGLENGTLKPLVGLSFPLDQAPAAHVEVIEHANGSAGKITLHPWQ